ncbi:hypothetical protein OK016_17210 [Vibrio chagasii]|nr:hypothetical protein [Vibrio chagasii]
MTTSGKVFAAVAEHGSSGALETIEATLAANAPAVAEPQKE